MKTILTLKGVIILTYILFYLKNGVIPWKSAKQLNKNFEKSLEHRICMNEASDSFF